MGIFNGVWYNSLADYKSAVTTGVHPTSSPAPDPMPITPTPTPSPTPSTGTSSTAGYNNPVNNTDYNTVWTPPVSNTTNTSSSSVTPAATPPITQQVTPPITPTVDLTESNKAMEAQRVQQQKDLASAQTLYKQQQLDFQKQQDDLQRQISTQLETQKKQMEQQSISLRDLASQFSVPIDFQNGQLSVNGQNIDPSKYGLQNVNGHFVGNPDQVASVFGLQPIRGQFEQKGADVGYNNGLISINEVNFDPQAEGAVNIGGHFYASADTLNSMYQRSGAGEFNKQTTQQQQQQSPEVVQQQKVEEVKLQQIQSDIEYLKQTEIDVFKNPPVDHSDQISTILKSLSAYKGIYSEQVGSLVQQTLAADFQYSAENDTMLKDAASFANNQIMEQMNTRGLLNSSVTGDKFQQVYKDLMPQYYNIAYQRFNDNLSNNFKKIDVLNKLNEQDYDKYYQFSTAAINQIEKLDTKTYNSYKDNLAFIDKQLTQKETEKTNEIKLQEKKIADAWDDVSNRGYVTNDASLILGLPINTPSSTVKAKAEDRLFQLQKEANQVITDAKKASIAREEKLADLAVVREEKDAAVKVKEKEDARKVQAGKVLTLVASMSPDEALSEITKNMTLLSEQLGPELSNVIESINKAKQTSVTNQRADEASRRADATANRSIASAERANATAERAANIAAKAEEIKSLKVYEDEADKWLVSYEKSLGTDYNDEQGKFLPKYYYDMSPNSTQRKDAFDGLNARLENSGATGEQIHEILKRKQLDNFLKK